jgi:hypothetical protein
MYFLNDRKNLYNLIHYDKNVQLGQVVSIEDPNFLGRIKVRIKGTYSKGGDDGVLDKDLPWCTPMIPKFYSSQPKVGEAVFIFVFSDETIHIDRMYLGPLISQPQQLNYDPFYTSALAGFSFGSETPRVSVSNIPQIKGVFPAPEDISVQGRYNTDITQKTNEVVIRAGKFKSYTPDQSNPFNFAFNANTQAYIQIKNDVQVSPKGNTTLATEESFGTITNIVANKINLITHADGSPRFNVTNQDNLISDDEMSRILDEAHQLPFGDVLLDYLKLLKDALFFHVHNGNGNPSSGESLVQFREKAEGLEKAMLSKNIRIN